MTETDIAEILDIIDDEYYSLGVTSGSEALQNLLCDFADDRFDINFEEWGITKQEFFHSIIVPLIRRWKNDGRWGQSHAQYYGLATRSAAPRRRRRRFANLAPLSIPRRKPRLS